MKGQERLNKVFKNRKRCSKNAFKFIIHIPDDVKKARKMDRLYADYICGVKSENFLKKFRKENHKNG